jgi:hypothetical protein
VDELQWVRQVQTSRPSVFDDVDGASQVLSLKPQYRQGYFASASLDSFIKQHYTVSEQAADQRWSEEHRQMIARMSGNPQKNLQVAGYDSRFFAGYTNNGFRGTRAPVCYKVFFEFTDPISDLTPALYLKFAEYLSEQGFHGDSKVPLAPGQARFHYNNLIVHAANLQHALYAEELGIRFFGGKLARTGRGIDSYTNQEPLDWHHFLAANKGSLNGLPPVTIQYLNFAPSLNADVANAGMRNNVTASQSATSSTRQIEDLADAQKQADEIINHAKREAANYDAQADRIIQEMRATPAAGRGAWGRTAYNDSAIEAATHDLRERSKFALERGQREAAELIKRARVRAGLPEKGENPDLPESSPWQNALPKRRD